jgi:cytochrome c-type biogenesis protein CcmH
MTWLIAIVLALLAFAIAAFAMGVSRGGWTTFAAALALGLAGYATQASPDAPGAPGEAATGGDVQGWSLVDARIEMVGGGNRSTNDKVLIADAFARRGQYADAAALLNGATADNPRDADAWLALGNALVEHADGTLTQPAMLAYRRAAEADPGGIGAGYFLGLALIRQGRLMEARGVWASTLEGGATDAAGRASLEQQLARLDGLLASGGQVPVPEQE